MYFRELWSVYPGSIHLNFMFYMGKPQQTVSKKEKEKARIKKRQDKQKKKEERKAGGSSSADDMIAYVDEHGNITDTPPDPGKREKVKAEDIPLGTPSRDDDDTDRERTGIVTYFDTSKGYGFIKDSETSESIFTHINNHKDAIGENDKVSYRLEQGLKGINAVDVKKIV